MIETFKILNEINQINPEIIIEMNVMTVTRDNGMELKGRINPSTLLSDPLMSTTEDVINSLNYPFSIAIPSPTVHL